MKGFVRRETSRVQIAQIGALALLVVVLLSGGCSSSDGSQVASGPGTPVATTPPLALPPVLSQADQAASVQGEPSADSAVATTAPVQQPTAAATTAPATAVPETASAESDSEATAVPETATAEPEAIATPESDPTAVPETATAEPEATTTPESDPTAVPETAETPTPTAPEPTAAAVVSADGPVIALGDFDVVNLVTGATQNIAELSPSGATMLWFWAPH